VKAGMQRAKAQGKHTGRPSLPPTKRQRILELVAEGNLSKRAIARSVGVSVQTVLNVAKTAEASSGRTDRARLPRPDHPAP
jgi:DNA invertase Pin-like site-specific DNA recombinase